MRVRQVKDAPLGKATVIGWHSQDFVVEADGTVVVPDELGRFLVSTELWRRTVRAAPSARAAPRCTQAAKLAEGNDEGRRRTDHTGTPAQKTMQFVGAVLQGAHPHPTTWARQIR